MGRGLWYYTEGSVQDHPQEKEMQKGKVVVWWGWKIAEKRREAKGKGEKERLDPFECRSPKNSKER